MKRYVFIKLRESIPIIKNNKIIDQKAGGIKLEYEMYAEDNIHFRIGKRDIYIPYWKYKPQKITFIRLLKRHWDFKNYPMAKNFQGMPKELYTNLWLILQSKKGSLNCYDDVNDISKDIRSLRIKTLCTKREHHKIIKNLKESKDSFSIPVSQIFF